ncbi:RDD family protein [Bacillus sp. B15-48]|uniref:RDD family protein n=1 Tax=Bacillus sp. B15-48 TaxID=1548601 RepID=UPI00193F8A89|nr:RDD family protein [Bacillus sp. B15-48]MBM4762565.1 RDD family protein [Bacillus sp. B15-48]
MSTYDEKINEAQVTDEPQSGESPIHTQKLSSDQPTAFRYAGFWMRFWAYLMDLLVIGSINNLFIYPVFRTLGISIVDSGMFSPIAIATAISFYLYFVLMTKFLGQTLGKMVFGIKVIHLNGEKLSWGTVLYREWIGRFISTTIWITYVIVAFLPRKQGLHDLFAETSVIHEK